MSPYLGCAWGPEFGQDWQDCVSFRSSQQLLWLVYLDTLILQQMEAAHSPEKSEQTGYTV